MLRHLAGVDHLGGNCPVQGFGRVGDKGLYFRSRGEWWTVDIGEADADADYAKGLVAMMIRVLSEHTPDEIINAPLNFIEAIGFKNMLSMKRAGGLASMIKQMKLDALAYKAKKV